MSKKPTEEEVKETVDDNVATPTGVPMETVNELVAAFKETVAAVANKPTAPAVPAEDPVAKRAKLLEEFEEVQNKANEKAATGDVAGAVVDLYQGLIGMNQQTAVDPEKDPATRGLINNARRLAKAENKEVFDKWGSEIEAEMAKAGLNDRFDPDNWDKAIRIVKANHIDEIIEEKIKATKDRDNEPTLVAPGSRGSSDDDAAPTLDEDDLKIAAAFGKDEETYADILKSYRNARTGPMSVALIPDGPVEKGKF